VTEESNNKAERRNKLFQIGVEALEQQGWQVERIPGEGKSSVRRITKGNQSRKVSIRTTWDTWIAFPRNERDTGFRTLADVDVVLAVSVDDWQQPKFVQVHMIEADEMRQRFDRAYKARKKAEHVIPLGRGLWVSLYDEERDHPVSYVGAGAGLAHPPIARVPLVTGMLTTKDSERRNGAFTIEIEEAKRRLADALGIEPSSIKISIEA